MNIWAVIGKSISAIFMGTILGVIALFALTHFFPSASDADSQFSVIGISGGVISGVIGIYVGWRWALDVADEAASKFIEILFLGVGALILAVIAFVVKMF